jgi:hypothetical protein
MGPLVPPLRAGERRDVQPRAPDNVPEALHELLLAGAVQPHGGGPRGLVAQRVVGLYKFVT